LFVGFFVLCSGGIKQHQFISHFGKTAQHVFTTDLLSYWEITATIATTTTITTIDMSNITEELVVSSMHPVILNPHPHVLYSNLFY
jgi:hypothetical protein